MSTKADDELFGEEHIRAYRESKGQRGYHWKNGTIILLLNTRGKKSGEPRTAPLIYRPDGDRYVIVASKGGMPEHPSWYVNMHANPDDVSIEVKDEKFPVTFYDAEGEERERLWKYLAEAWPDYDEYQKKTDRQIPIVVMERKG